MTRCMCGIEPSSTCQTRSRIQTRTGCPMNPDGPRGVLVLRTAPNLGDAFLLRFLPSGQRPKLLAYAVLRIP